MNKDTAGHADTVLRCLLGLPIDGEPVPYHDLRHATAALAQAVQLVLPAGVGPAEVARQWGDRAPWIITGPAYVLRLDAAEIRGYFEDDECLDCDDQAEHECDRIRVRGVSDEQLVGAANRVLNRDNPLDSGISPTYEQILSVALDAAAREETKTAG